MYNFKKNGDKKTVIKKKKKGPVLGLPKTSYFKKKKIQTKNVGKSKAKKLSFMHNKEDEHMNPVPVEDNNIHKTSFKTNAQKQNIDIEQFVEIKVEEKTIPEKNIFENNHTVALQIKANNNETYGNMCSKPSFEIHDNIATNSTADQCAKDNNDSVFKTNSLVADLLLQIPENEKSDDKSNILINENDVVNDNQNIQGIKDVVSNTSEDSETRKDICDHVEQSTNLKTQTTKVNENISDRKSVV